MEMDFPFDQEDLANFMAFYMKSLWIFGINYFQIKFMIFAMKINKNQKKKLKNFLKYCELDWDKTVLNFHKNTRAVNCKLIPS